MKVSTINKVKSRMKSHTQNAGGGYNNALGLSPGSRENYTAMGGYDYQAGELFGRQVGRLSPQRRTIPMTIENTNTGSTASVNLFDTFGNADNSQVADISLTINGYESGEFLNRSLAQTQLYILGARYEVETSAQLNRPLTWVFKRERGSRAEEEVFPFSSKTPQNEQGLIVDLSDVDVLLDGKTALELTLEADEKVIIHFFVKSVIENGNQGVGVPSVAETENPPPMGSFMQDFKRRE